MTSSTTPLEGRRRLGVPLAVLYVGLPAYVGAVGFSVVQIVSDNSATVSALAIGGIALFTVLLAWVQAQYQVEETERRRLVLVSALAVIALALVPIGGPAVMYLMTVSGIAGAALRTRAAIFVIGLSAIGITAIGLLNGFLAREIFQSVVIALVVGLFTLGLRRMIDTNDELAATRAQLADLAVVNERLRIARDLHDLLGHSLTVIRAKSELATRIGPADPDRAIHEMVEVEEIARQSLVDVRAAVANYRRPTLAAERANARMALAAAGIAADFHDDDVALSPDADETLAWVLREAVTNVVRHSGAARCHVRTCHDGTTVRLEVVDEGKGAPSVGSDGSGLIGLRERVAAVGGTLDVGAAEEGGFGVVARVPVHA
jgi:two-component system sensor histidine kinase DesK